MGSSHELPGRGTVRQTLRRRILLTPDHAIYLPGGKTISGSTSRDPLNTGDVQYLRAGLLMGKITSGGKYAPSIMGVLTTAYDKDSSTGASGVIQVSAATATEMVRRTGATGTFRILGPPTANATTATETFAATAINVTTGVVSISGSFLAADYVAGSFIQPNDGSQTPLGLLDDGDPLKVTDVDEANVDVQLSRFLIGGVLDASQVINWPSDTSLQNWVRAVLNGGVVDLNMTTAEQPARGPFIFDDRY
ncbi:hypothetical protein LCGC14_1554040 [marine sediment metagenome]|uniref:Uncharacterized protein n=1 Tax=marine sediment metagenome TaxID=412755 RepID=A0A0F9LQ75_9ZZZZ